LNYKRLAALFFAVTSLSAQAEQRWFEVELLMFQRDVDIQSITEHLSSEQIMVDTSNSVSLLRAAKTGTCLTGQNCFSNSNPTVIGGSQFAATGFKRLGSSRLQLTTQRKSLEKHANFDPVLHMAWRMPVARGTSAKPLHIFAGKNLAMYMQQPIIEQPVTVLIADNTDDHSLVSNVDDSVVSTVMTELEQATQQHDTTPLETATEDKWAIDGNFKIYLDHYLYIDSQLIIRKAITEAPLTTAVDMQLIDDNNGVQIAKFDDTTPVALTSEVSEVKSETIVKEVLFDQSRRLRSGEIHYLDHPLMGIIVQIRKIPAEELAFTDEQLLDPETLLTTETASDAEQPLNALPVPENGSLPVQLPISEALPETKPFTNVGQPAV